MVSRIKVPRLMFNDSSRAKVGPIRYVKNRFSQQPQQPEQESRDRERSSISSTAGRGSYIHNQSDFTFKVVFLGDASVGKTCLAHLVVHRKVTTEQTQNTIGFDHHIKEMLVGGLPIMINLWDTAGMEQFRNALVQQYYRNVNGIVFVYDITNPESFENVDNWYTEAVHYSENKDRLQMVLIGNKKDMESERRVSEETAREYANAKGMTYTEVSAKDFQCLAVLDGIMMTLANQMLADRQENSFTRSMTNVIRLSDDDWEMVEAPEGQIPENVYQPQNESTGMSLRDQFTSSVRNVAVRTNNRVSSSNCSC